MRNDVAPDSSAGIAAQNLRSEHAKNFVNAKGLGGSLAGVTDVDVAPRQADGAANLVVKVNAADVGNDIELLGQ